MHEIEVKQWCSEQRSRVQMYLAREGVKYGHIEEEPSWLVEPYVSIWAVESKNSGKIGWWVICGDLPTDYISFEDAKEVKQVIKNISERWSEVADCMIKNEPHPTIEIGKPNEWSDLGPLLKKRAKILSEWANDDSLWEE